jgi:uncharacterized phiE125 gp8 family phage protein
VHHSATKVITQPTSEPVTVAQAFQHSIDIPSEDASYVQACIGAAREFAENYQDRALLTQTLRYSLDSFPLTDIITNPFGFSSAPIRLPRPPLVSVTQITYLDSDGDTQTLDEAAIAAGYVVYSDHEPGLIFPNWGAVWPVALPQPGSVTITYVAGNSDASLIPYSTKQAIMLLANHLYENRLPAVVENLKEIPFGICSLLDYGVWGSYA